MLGPIFQALWQVRSPMPEPIKNYILGTDKHRERKGMVLSSSIGAWCQVYFFFSIATLWTVLKKKTRGDPECSTWKEQANDWCEVLLTGRDNAKATDRRKTISPMVSKYKIILYLTSATVKLFNICFVFSNNRI